MNATLAGVGPSGGAVDTYPSEFISHLHPLLFAAGLGPAVPATATSPTDPPGPSAAAAPPTNGVAGSTAPSVASPSLANGDEASTTSSDPFVRLVASLRKAFQVRKGWSIWDNTRGAHHDFHAVLVDKNVRFPPIKARPVSVPPGTPIPPLHSPISPLSPSSPLFPDGIMAPIWLRKHREMIPAVFILVLRIHEYDHTQDADPLDAAKAKDDEERHHDTDLVKEILDRKRLTSERGIKLAVVLLCSRRLLDDPALDQRLSLIRRQSGLDSRASLFVISPVPQAEVTNFVQSLREELFPAALDYYREHGRRVRRKRARQMPKGGLSDKGWNVRYDYKMAFFSEMRGETEVALKHYEDCYNTLIGMFANSTLLPPRTKRWAEAKVLADCTSVKVAKMHMYLSEPSLAVAQLNRHVATFRELSNTWGIGDKTFEFWSWQSKQYRLFGDLVAIGIRNGFSLPILRPVPSSRVLPPGAPPPPTSVMMPSNALQHPGYYFFLAAGCAIERWERFKAVKAAYEAARDAGAVAPIPEGGKRPPPLAMGPALTHESKVDHADIIIEVRTILASFFEICSLTNVTSRSCVQLYTKAYEFFKAHRTKNMTFYVASQIALTHYEAGNHEMVLKFNDRIAKNYRKDRWSGVLDSILQLSLESAQRIGDWESAIRCCLELMAPTSHITVDERDRYSALALEMMQTRAPASPGKSALSFRPTDSAPLFYCRLAFWRASVDIRDAAPFQLVLEAPTSSRSSAFIFSELVINFTGGVGPIIVSHSGVETPSKSSTEVIRLLDKGDARLEADLCWRDGSTKTFEGVVTANESCELTVSDVILKTKIGEWDLSFALQPEVPPTTSAEWFLNSTQRVSLSHLQSGVCSVSARKLRLDFSIEHLSPAYVGEVYPVHIEFVNEDEFDIDVYLDILLQPGEDESPNRILVDEEWSLSFIKGISLGTITPKTRLRKTMHLECVGAAGDRLLDLSVRSIASSLKTAPVAEVPSAPDNGIIEPAPPSNNFTELLRSIIIPAVYPLRSAFQVMVHQKRKALKPLLDLAPPSEWDAASDVTVVGTIHAAGPWDLEMTSLKLVSERTGGVRVVHSSLTHLDKNVLLDWNASDLFNCLFQLEVASSHAPHASSAPFIEAYWRRRRSAAAVSRTLLPLPPLEPVMLEPAVTLSLPATLRIHELTKMRYKFSNPTNRVTTLSFTVEGAEPGTFTFAGPRKYPSFVLAPDEERTLDMVVVPLVVGPCALPRMRVFHHERVPLAPEDQSNEREAHLDPSAPEESARRARELKVVAETAVHEMKDPAQVLMEEDLRAARGGDRLDDAIGNPPHSPFVVMVLPR